MGHPRGVEPIVTDVSFNAFIAVSEYAEFGNLLLHDYTVCGR